MKIHSIGEAPIVRLGTPVKKCITYNYAPIWHFSVFLFIRKHKLNFLLGLSLMFLHLKNVELDPLSVESLSSHRQQTVKYQVIDNY